MPTAQRKRLAVVGAPRSGTRYVHLTLRAAGLDVWHEQMGPDGTVSGLFAVPHTWMPGAHRGRPGEVPAAFAFDHRWALIRDPLRAIPSFAQVFELGDLARWWSEVGVPMDDVDSLTRALRAWVATYEHLAAEGVPFLRVEDFDRRWPELAGPLGLPQQKPAIGDQNMHHGLAPTSWEELAYLDPGWARRAKDLAVDQGYREDLHAVGQ